MGRSHPQTAQFIGPQTLQGEETHLPSQNHHRSQRLNHMFTLKFETENEAFTDQGEETDEARLAESARILREIADKMEAGTDGGTIFDVNGNKIGQWCS
jgi:hypothetical protein